MFLSAGEGAAGDSVRYKERKKSSEEGKKKEIINLPASTIL
jgi:hypothetical protein